jgi:diguanylate cyclase (GGDEF)-like protein/PAS domain S-box-containing protein
MQLYLFSAWGLTLVCAIVIGSWYDRDVAWGLPLVVLSCWALFLLAGYRRRGAMASGASGIDTEQQRAWGRQLAEDLPTPAAVLSGRTVIFANRAFLEIIGLAGRDDQIVGMPFTNLVHPLDHDRCAALLQEARNSGTPVGANLRLTRADATLLRSELSVSTTSPIPDTFFLQLGVTLAAPVHRADADGSTPQLVDRIEQVIFQLDSNARFTFVNAAWRRLTGHPVAKAIGQPLVAHLHPDEQKEAEARLHSVAGGALDHLLMEVRLIAGDDTLHWVELRARAFSLAGDEAPVVVGSLTEVTRRKQREEQLRSSRRHLNTLLDNVPGMVYRGRHDRDWTMEWVSDGCAELTGYEPRDIVDNAAVAFGDLIHPEDREFVWALVETQLAQGKGFQLSYRIVDAAGEIKWVWEQGKGVFSSTGDLLALEGFITDVSARRGAEEEAKRRLWFDARTGLASKAIFDDRLGFVLDQTRLWGYPFAVLWVDLDNFGEINARFGRDFGDRALAQMARRFKVLKGPGTTVTRAGGDEFAVLLTDLREGYPLDAAHATTSPGEAAMGIAERVGAMLAEPMRIDGRDLSVSASTGIAVSTTNYPSAEAMLAAARRASMAARAADKGLCRIAAM